MIDVDWSAFLLGLAIGASVSAVFFAGLAFGIRIAFGATRPTAVLLLSAGLRIALFLAVGWLVAQIGAWALAGYALSFLVVRFVIIAFARVRPAKGGL